MSLCYLSLFAYGSTPRSLCPAPLRCTKHKARMLPMFGSLVVNEIFLSVQGESSFAGLPRVFIRLTGCNLRCAWCWQQLVALAPAPKARPTPSGQAPDNSL